ncbi:MAG: rhomboid family intramembrane serine protease [Actinobacteria bacterium]|nr:rhomboid family intramembrane serine protease [Actinomycetota bacterium]MBW3647039.1 rhomboid family intramembrane serine protease [Actinomycetota bacterium]
MQSPPVCYRHPGRETYVRCNRCERPICPDCMVAASVGFQCPECVAAGGKDVRQARTVFGGRLTGDTSRLSIAIIALNVLVYLAGLLLGERELQEQYGNRTGGLVRFVEGGRTFDVVLGGVATGEYYRLFTAAFLHAGPLHLALNMFALAQLGPVLESALGRTRFLALYLLAALGGSALSFLVSDPGTLGVGASGAIFGLFGAYYIVMRRLGGETKSILVLLAINLVITFSIPIIDWRAHVGGLVTGALVAAAFAYAPKGPRRGRVQAGACAAIALVLVVLITVRKLTVGS